MQNKTVRMKYLILYYYGDIYHSGWLDKKVIVLDSVKFAF